MQIDVQDFNGQCPCGKTHHLAVKKMVIAKGAITQVIPFIEAEKLDKCVGIVTDTHTQIYARPLVEVLGEKGYLIVLDAEGLHADEHGVALLNARRQVETSCLIALGSGTIHDLTRYVAHQDAIPFIACPTAASVDGFVSTVSAMTWEGFKRTMPGVSPVAVFADTQVFKEAPTQLTASGVADLLGKYTALLDWKIAQLVTGEYLCERIVEVEEAAINQVVEVLDGLKVGDEKAYESLMYALLLSGLAMQMIGNSRPASGAEHHMSHLWEMHAINAPIDALHGEKVGVALALVCDYYKARMQEGSLKVCGHYEGIPHEVLQEVFGVLYPSIAEENHQDLLAEVDLEVLQAALPTISAWVEALPSGEVIRGLLHKVDGKENLESIGLDAGVLEASLNYSPYVRARVTLMRLLKLIK